MGKKLSLVAALSWIMGSVFVVSGFSFMLIKNTLREKNAKLKDSAYAISRLVQTGPQRDALKTSYLAELLNLSSDKPISIYSFDSQKARSALLRSPVIKEASVKVFPPQTVYVDYTVRQPIALLYNYENIAIDEEGRLFPLLPFYAPKKLPYLYFDEVIKNPLKSKTFELAHNLIKILSEPAYRGLFHVRFIDVSHAFANTYGKREIVLLTEDEIVRTTNGKETLYIFPRLLRLSTKNYAVELGNYLELREYLLETECARLPVTQDPSVRFTKKVIDLRLPNLAFIDSKKKTDHK